MVQRSIATVGVSNQTPTRRMVITNGTCVSFCNQPKAHYLATSRESRRRVQAFRIRLRQESLMHILASPGYAPGTIAVNVTWMEREFNACQTHRSMFPSIINHFPVIQPVSSKVRHFSTFFAHFGLPWVRPCDNRGKCYMDGKRIQCWSNASLHVPIYFQPFTSYSEILVGNCNFFYPLAFNAPIGVFPLEFWEKV